MRKIELKIAIWKDGKFYIDQCLNVDVSSFDKTRKEALANIDEALELCFEDMKRPKILKIEELEMVNLSLRYA